MAAVRKLAAILAADVVGYSRMMGEDEAGTAKAVLERQEAAAPIVAATRRAGLQDDGRRPLRRISLDRFGGGMRARDPAHDGRAQRRPARKQARRLSHRRSSRRRARSKATTFWATASTSRRGSRASPSRAACACRRRLRARAREGRGGFRRPRRDEPEKHRPADPHLRHDGARRIAGPGRGAKPSRTRRASPLSSCLSPTSAAGQSRTISSTASRSR